MGDSGWTNQVIQAFLVEIIASVPGSGLFVYRPSVGPGNLFVSIAGANGADSSGNTYQTGVQVHGTGGSNIEMTDISGVPFIFFTTGASEITTSANIQALIINPGASEQNELFVVGPQITAFPQYVYVDLAAPAKDGSIGAAGSLQYNDGTTSHGLVLWGNAFGGVKVQTLFAGDTSSYDVGEQRLTLTADLVINTGPFSQQVFSIVTLGVGKYLVDGVLHLGLSAAGQPEFEFFGFGGLTLTTLMDFYEINDAAPATFGNSGTVNGLGVGFTGAVMGAGTRNVRFSGVMNVTVAGTMGLFAATSNVADPFTVTALSSYMIVRPVY